MITERFGKHSVTTWQTIDELPIDRFSSWNKYMMLDGALGGSFEDIDRLHIATIAQVLDDKQKAMQQLMNLRELVYGVISGVNYQHRAYCCLVHSIDGVETTDYSDTGIGETLKQLSQIGVSHGDVKKKTRIAKKLYSVLWKSYFRIISTVRRNTITTKN
jgi:hypothetical protein